MPRIYTIFLAVITCTLAATTIIFPNEVLQASKRGVEMWATSVFPSLLPFFIIAELLIAFGVVHFIGVLLEPLMRPLFNVPGAGGFVWAMGMASGYPSGAKFTARLRQANQLTKTEAERLVSFTNSSSPLFIIGAVAIGFFHDQQLGILLAVVHYISNFFVGVSMRYYKRNESGTMYRTSFSFHKALGALHHARVQDNRSLGKVLGDSVERSIKTLIMIGGFIVLFSVITQLMKQLYLTNVIAEGLKYILRSMSMEEVLALPFISGIFEITIGAFEMSQINSSMLHIAMLVSVFLAFNGFSVQAQVASILATTDVRFKPYFVARLIHGVYAIVLTIILFKPLYQEPIALVSNWQNFDTKDISSIWLSIQSFFIVTTLIILFMYFMYLFLTLLGKRKR
ncbi:sporulation integral membrane protein YlbJ [Gracilibacillus halotolerans]|uniref:Sporulation integral membrane protein YlbJ n=1 Tax=Gracilibacillus halotolerans TaxID=74386 RepID=A0A841RFU9_9BACI|nr:sporulation integral membrane protein YlbJ [Gracilibacillus halotolerans]MBB6511339.1 sporulation integral membrane protein YlbJ [Gracilibacillus halotolerans]